MNAKQRETIMRLASAVHETVRETGAQGAPAGPMFAAFQAAGISLHVFEQICAGLVGAGVLTKRGHIYYAVHHEKP